MRRLQVLGAVLVVSLGAVCIPAGSGLTSARSSRSGPSTELLVLDGSTLQTVEAASGRILRQVTVHGPTATLGSLSVSRDGQTAYAERSVTPCGDVVAISLTTGRQGVVVTHAADPALSPNGSELAYAVVEPSPVDQSGACSSGDVVVWKLRTGARQMWDLEPEDVTGLSWAPNGRQLLVTSIGARQTMQLLDTAQPGSVHNPIAVGGMALDAPVLLRDGTILGILATCSDGASCPTTPPATPKVVDLLQPPTGRILSEFRQPKGLAELLVDPAGRNVEAVVDGPGATVTLDRLVGHHLLLTRSYDTDNLVAAWIPAS